MPFCQRCYELCIAHSENAPRRVVAREKSPTVGNMHAVHEVGGGSKGGQDV